MEMFGVDYGDPPRGIRDHLVMGESFLRFRICWGSLVGWSEVSGCLFYIL